MKKLISVKSAGYNPHPNLAEISIDGVRIEMKDRKNNIDYNRGINLVIWSSKGDIIWAGAFDTWESSFESELLQDQLDNAPEGSVVAAAIKDEGTVQLGLKARKSFERLGSKQVMDLKYRSGWAFIGRKSGTKGELLDEESSSGSLVVAKAHVEFSDINANSDSNSDINITTTNKPTDASKKVMVEFGGNSKLMKLDLSDDSIEKLRTAICENLNIYCDFKVEYWSPDFNAFIEVDDISELRANKAPKLRVSKITGLGLSDPSYHE